MSACASRRAWAYVRMRASVNVRLYYKRGVHELV